MADASAALGSAEVAGTLVSPSGFVKRASMRSGGAQAGLIGDLAMGAIASKTVKKAPDLPKFGAIGYLAASDQEFVILKTSQMGWKPKPKGEAVARVSRADVESVEMESNKVVSKLHLRFRDGASWDFDVPRAHRSSAREFVDRLGGQISS